MKAVRLGCLSVLLGGLAAALPAAAAPSVAIGYCTSDLAKAKAGGFDYAELAIRDFARLSAPDFAAFLATHRAVGLPTPVGYLFLPADLKVVGPEVDDARLDEYVRSAFDRAQTLGMRIVTFGSGDARRVPDGFAKDAALRQLVAFARRIAPEAERRGLVVTVEPQRPEETNIINSAAEGLDLVERVDHPAFELMVDFYHLASVHEDPGILLKAKGRVRHIHFANPNGRVFPREADEFDYAAFFANLRRIGYRGGLSIEAQTDDFGQDAPRAIAFLRAALKGPLAPPTRSAESAP